MKRYHLLVAVLLAAPAGAAQPAPVVDRGLPRGNLNAADGQSRSNVRWSWYGHGFVGDDFTIGGAGERWIVDAIRTWTVPGTKHGDPEHIGDRYQDVRLYFGAAGGDLTPLVAAPLAPGSDATANPRVRLTPLAGAGVIPYNEFGLDLRVWQVDFENLQLAVDGGVPYRFGVWGMGRAVSGEPGKSYPWFNHGSNAPLSIAPQDGADGVLLLFDGGGRFQGAFQAAGNGWDKSADIDVQVFAHRVDGAPQAR